MPVVRQAAHGGAMCAAAVAAAAVAMFAAREFAEAVVFLGSLVF